MERTLATRRGLRAVRADHEARVVPNGHSSSLVHDKQSRVGGPIVAAVRADARPLGSALWEEAQVGVDEHRLILLLDVLASVDAGGAVCSDGVGEIEPVGLHQGGLGGRGGGGLRAEGFQGEGALQRVVLAHCTIGLRELNAKENDLRSV
jgi:hypothetical protein